MTHQALLPSHPLYRLWTFGNAVSISNKKQLKKFTLTEEMFNEAVKSSLPPKVCAVLIKGIVTYLIHSFHRVNRDLVYLLKEIESPSLDSKKSKKLRKTNTKAKDGKFKARKKGFINSDSFSNSGNMYRVGFNNKSHINNPSEITLPEQNLNFYKRFQELNDNFAFLNANNMDFQEIMNNYFPGQNQFGDMGAFGENFGIDPLGINIKPHFQEALGLNFGLRGELFLSFMEKMTQNYKNFLMITPEKFKDRQYFDYYESDAQKRYKGSEEKPEKKSHGFEDTILRRDNVTRALNFGADAPKRLLSKEFLNSKKKKRPSPKELEKSLNEPYTNMSDNLMELWHFAQGKTDIFSRNIEILNKKEEEWGQARNAIEGSELGRQRNDSSHFYSTAEKMTEKLLSQNSLHFNAKSDDYSSKKGVSILDNGDFTPNYEAIEELTNEITSTTQFFGISESHFNPPTLSYEMSLGQYFNIKNVEESKINQSRKAFELAQEEKKFYDVLVEQSKLSKQVNFNYLIRNNNVEEKVSYFYSALVLVSKDKVDMKQKTRQAFGEIFITIV